MPDVKLSARNVRDLLGGRCDPQVMRVIEALAEQHNHLEKAMVQFAMLIDRLTDLMNQYNMIAEGIQKDAAKSVIKKHQEGDQYDEPNALKL